MDFNVVVAYIHNRGDRSHIFQIENPCHIDVLSYSTAHCIRNIPAIEVPAHCI